MKTPRWWYQRSPRRPLAAVLLKPLSWVWAGATARRIARANPYKSKAFVICVGNLTVGGTGKTPIVQALAERLSREGKAVHILSRGHGGALAGPVRVDPRVHTAAEVGDEPLMLAGAFPVWVARDRAGGARAAEAAGAKIIVMDDGHQNPSLFKDLSLVVVDGETRDGEWPFGDGAIFPAGPMREPLEAGLTRADAVIILMPPGLMEPDPALVAQLGQRPVLIAQLEPAGPPPDGPLLAFAGIGKPWKFERALKAAGGEVVEFSAFPDHATFDVAILAELAGRAKARGAGLVTTEKDWNRLPAAWREKVLYWPVRARFEDGRALDGVLGTIRK